MERAIKFYKETFAWKVTQMDYPGYAIFESCDMKYPLAGIMDDVYVW
jgi:predicted enzyme related to lactoylglutathione lyase